MTDLTLTPDDELLLARLETSIGRKDPNHPFLAALRGLRRDHLLLLNQNVALLSAELERIERADPGLRAA